MGPACHWVTVSSPNPHPPIMRTRDAMGEEVLVSAPPCQEGGIVRPPRRRRAPPDYSGRCKTTTLAHKEYMHGQTLKHAQHTLTPGARAHTREMGGRAHTQHSRITQSTYTHAHASHNIPDGHDLIFLVIVLNFGRDGRGNFPPATSKK